MDRFTIDAKQHVRKDQTYMAMFCGGYVACVFRMLFLGDRLIIEVDTNPVVSDVDQMFDELKDFIGLLYPVGMEIEFKKTFIL